MFNDFKAIKASDKYMNETINSKDYLKSLTEEEREALKSYTSTDYKDMNRILAGRFGTSKDSNNMVDEWYQSMTKTTKTLEKVIENAPGLKDNIITYRGFSDNNIVRWFGKDVKMGMTAIKKKGESETVLNIIKKNVIGTVADNPAFMSTSINSQKAMTFGDHILTLRVPKSTKGIYVESITSIKKEYEFIIQPNAKILFESVEWDKGLGKWHFKGVIGE